MEEAQLDALRSAREAKILEIAEKRRNVEALKQQRTEKWAAAKRAQSPVKQEKQKGAIGDLLSEIFGGDAVPASRSSQKSDDPSASPKRDLNRAATNSDLSKAKNFVVQRNIAHQTVSSIATTVFDKECQSEMTGEEVAAAAPKEAKQEGKSAITMLMKMAEQARFRQGHDPQALRMHAAAHAGEHPETKEVEEPAWMKVQPFSTEESEKIIEQEDFQQFFERAVELVERELGVGPVGVEHEARAVESWDCACDWNVLSDTGTEGETLALKHIKHVSDFVEDTWSRGRPITEVRASPHGPDTILVGYGERIDAAPTEPDGCVLLWNLGAKTNNTPESIFTAPSSVMTAHFNRFDPHLFFGGLVSGGIVLWDSRVGAGPVAWPHKGKGHGHPVQAMQHVGAQSSSNLVSGSSDGRVCVWSLAKLDAPEATIDLKVSVPEAQAFEPVSTWSLHFPENESNIFYVGAEDGSMYQANLNGDKAGITGTYTGHEGPVSGVALHPRGNLVKQDHSGQAAHQIDPPPGVEAKGPDTSFDLALTCSFDWSIKLWLVNQHHDPVCAFETFEDYVYDVRWHPVHPACFASVDGEGHVDLWNLNSSLESPLMVCENPNQRKLALNRCDWSLDGRKLAVGDSEGTLSVFGVDRSISEPRREEFQQFQDRMRQFQPFQFERSQIAEKFGVSQPDEVTGSPRRSERD